MTLAQSYYSGSQKQAHRVLINGVAAPNVEHISVRREFSEDNAVVVAICEITWPLGEQPASITRGDTVSVDLGYGIYLERKFTGYAFQPQRELGQVTWVCLDQLLFLTRVGEFPERDVSGSTVEAAVAQLVSDSGVTGADIQLDDFTLGTAVPAILDAGPKQAMVSQLLDIKDGYLWTLPNGSVVGRQVSFAPASAPSYNFGVNDDINARIIDGTDHDDPDFFRDQVIATGATPEAASEDDPPPDPLEVTATNDTSGLQRPPAPAGQHSIEPYSNGLLDTLTELGAYAERKLTRRCRNPRYVELEQIGHPFIQLGMTLGYNLPDLEMSGNWFVMGIEDSYGDGWVTRLQLTGGDEAGGSIGFNPIAGFTWSAVQQLLGDTLVTIYTVKSTAIDLDGTIVSTVYTGDVSGSGDPFTFAIDPADFPDGLELTQTVTDNDGLTGNTTETIPVEPAEGNAVTLPSIGLSRDNGNDFSPDGAQTWNVDGSGGTSNICALRPYDAINSGHAIYCNGGQIVVTRDALATPAVEVLADVGSNFVAAAWDWRNTLVVYAITADGRLYVSIDAGDTFGLYGGAGLRTTLGKPDLIVDAKEAIGLPAGAFGATPVFIFATDGHGSPVIAFDYNLTNAWDFVVFDGELAADLPGGDTLVICTACAPTEISGTMIGFRNTSGAVKCAYYLPPEGTGWKRATGLDALDGPGFIAGDDVTAGARVFRMMFPGSTSSWTSEDPASIAFVETTDVLPAGWSPTHGLWEADVLTGLTGLQGIYLVTAVNDAEDGAVFKSIDALFSLTMIYPAGGGFPAFQSGGRAMMISIGAPAGLVAPGGGTSGLTVEGSLGLTEELIAGLWETIRASGTTGGSISPTNDLVRFGTDDMIGGTQGQPNGGIFHTGPSDTDWARTLANEGSPADFNVRVVRGFSALGNGHVYAAFGAVNPSSGHSSDRALIVKRSTDYGLTWSDFHTDPGFTADGYTDANTPLGYFSHYHMVTVDQLDENHIFIGCAYTATDTGRPNAIYTTDGSSWTQQTAPRPYMGGGTFSRLMIVNSGRVLCIQADTTTDANNKVSSSDDDGATWDLRTIATAGRILQTARYRSGHGNKVIIAVKPTGVSDTAIMMSDDNGETFAEIIRVGVSTTVTSLEYDAGTDTLFVGMASRVFQVATLSTAPTLSEITSDLTANPNGANCMALGLA